MPKRKRDPDETIQPEPPAEEEPLRAAGDDDEDVDQDDATEDEDEWDDTEDEEA